MNNSQLSKVKCSKLKKAFTLLELLLVIAIIAVLAGIIMFALKPADRLREANQTKYLSNANDLERAFNSYVVDNGGNLPTAFNSLTYGYYDICRQGQSGSCVSLDELVTNGKMVSIPIDSDNQTATTTGFKLKYDPIKKEAFVYSNDELFEIASGGRSIGEGLMAWWKMDEASGTVVTDSSGQGNTGTSVTPDIVLGKYARALDFIPANDDYINVGSGQAMNEMTGFSFSTWIYTDSFSTESWPTLYNREGQNGSTGYIWIYQGGSGDINYQYANGSSYSAITLACGLTTATWEYLTVVHDRNFKVLKCYVNGVLKNSQVYANTALTTTTGTGYIGTYNGSSANSYHFDGKLDETRLYNRALNSTEVQALYSYAPSPVAHWKFDEPSGTSVVNAGTMGSSLNGNFACIGTCPTRADDALFGRSLLFTGSGSSTRSYINIPSTIPSIQLGVEIGSKLT